MSNLKQCGLAILMYANDYDGRVFRREYIPGVHEWYWHNILYNYGYLQGKTMTNIKVGGCPSQPPYQASGNFLAYGFRIPPSTYGISIGPQRIVLFDKIPDPSNYICLADTIYRKTSSFYPNQAASLYLPSWEGGSGIHLRHTGLANCWFADGHVEAANKSRLKECGATRAIEKDGTEVEF